MEAGNFPPRRKPRPCTAELPTPGLIYTEKGLEDQIKKHQIVTINAQKLRRLSHRLVSGTAAQDSYEENLHEEGKELDENAFKSSELFSGNAVTVVNTIIGRPAFLKPIEEYAISVMCSPKSRNCRLCKIRCINLSLCQFADNAVKKCRHLFR